MKTIRLFISLILFLSLSVISPGLSNGSIAPAGSAWPLGISSVLVNRLLPGTTIVFPLLGWLRYVHALESDSAGGMDGNAVWLIEDGGMAELVGENIQHPNGNIFDQILLTGVSATVQAKEGQITRVSFLDENGDIVQAEFSGAGTFTITLDPTTYKPPEFPALYNQDVKYVTGKPSVVVDGADETTYFSIFTVGTLNAVNQALFPEGQEYDAKADVKLVEVINSTEIGGMLMANAEFSGKNGNVGIDARNVKVKQRVTFGDIDASDDAVPYLLFDEGAFDNDQAGPGPMIAGGDLVQTNGAAIVVRSPGQVNPSFTGLPTLANYKSDDTPLEKVRPDELVKAKFKIEDGEEITPKECNCAQGGGLMFDDRYDAVDNPFPLDDGIKDFNYDDISFDSETGYYGKISRSDYEYGGEGDVDKSVAMKVIAVPADHDGIDNDGDGEIDEDDEMELIVFTRDKIIVDPGGGFQDDDGTFINKDGSADGIDNDGDGEIDEPGEMFPVKENTQREVTDSGFIVVPADHDGVDNDGDGEIDEPGEYEVVYQHEDEDFNDLRLNTEGQYVDADGNIVESIVQVERTEYIRAEGPQEGGYPGGAHDDGLDNDGDGEIDEPGEQFPPPPTDPTDPDPGPLNHKKDNDDEGSEDDTEEEEKQRGRGAGHRDVENAARIDLRHVRAVVGQHQQDQADDSLFKCFPYEDIELYQATMDEETIAFARKWLKTDDIHMRVGCLIARYPGHTGGGTGFDDSGLHIDNGNNSLLPVSEDMREFGQIVFCNFTQKI